MLGLGLGLNKSYNKVVGISTQQLCRYDFNGSTQYISYGDILDSVLSGSSLAFTIEMWVKRDSAVGNQAIFSKHDSGSGNRQVLLQFNGSTGQIQWIQSVNGTTIQNINTDDAFTQIDEWIYIAFTLDYTAGSYSTAGTYYVNGGEVPSTASTTTKNAIFNSNAPVVIGATNTQGTPVNYFDGSIRNVVVTSRVKTAEEIEARYNLGNLSEPSATDLELYSNFKTDTFSTNWTIKDLSINTNDGVSVNMVEGSRTCEIVELYQNVIGAGFTNSVDYDVQPTYTKRSTNSEFNFNFTGTEIWIKAFVDGSNNNLAVMVNNSLDQNITVVDGELTKITFAPGVKYIQLIEPARATTALLGLSLYEIVLLKSEYTKVNQGNVVDRYVFLGDSIAQGSSANAPKQINGYTPQFKYTDLKPVTTLGYGGAELSELGDTDLPTTLSWVNTAFNNTTGRKVLTIMLGTNDYGSGNLATNVDTHYKALVDGIIANIPDVEIFIIGCTIRTDDGALLDTYRANSDTMCSTRSNCAYIDGKSIVDVGNLADNVHPNQTGHNQLHDAIDSIIL